MNDPTKAPADAAASTDPAAPAAAAAGAKKPGKLKKARALSDCTVGGVPYRANSLIEASAEDVDAACADGVADANPAAVRAVTPAANDAP